MFTTESKLFFGTAALAVVAAIVYSIAANDPMGSLLLVGVLAAAAFLGLLVVGRPLPVGPEGAVAPARHRPEPLRSTGWPAAAGIAAVLLLIGFATDVPTLVVGAIAVAFAGAGWLAEVWRQHRAAAWPGALETQQRVLSPAGVPLLAIMAIAVIVISVSRILLAVPKDASVVVALVAAAGILVAAFLVAARPRISSNALTALLAVVGVAVVIGGAVAASSGERRIEREPNAKVALTARGTAFTQKDLTVPADGHVVIIFHNEDKDIQHNVAVYRDPAHTRLIYAGAVFPGISDRAYSFRSPGKGMYFYRCDMHPTTMLGTLRIEAAAPRAQT